MTPRHRKQDMGLLAHLCIEFADFVCLEGGVQLRARNPRGFQRVRLYARAQKHACYSAATAVAEAAVAMAATTGA